MSTTFASLGIAVESSQAVKAADDLDKLVDAAEGAEKAIDDLGKTGAQLADTGKRIVQTETEVAQGIDKTTDARERQSGASRKVTDSAASEISIIRNLNNAMERSGDSYTSLATAGDLLNKARAKGLVTAEDELEFENKILASHERLEKAEAKETAQKQKLVEAENRKIEALKRTVNSIDPVTAKLAKLEAQEKALEAAHKAGVVDANRYNEALAKIGKDRAGLTETEGAFDKLKLGTRQAQENVMQLTNALQSGDWGSGARAIAQLGAGAGSSAASMLSLAVPVALVAAAVGTLAAAYFQGADRAEKFNNALIVSGGAAGKTTAQLTAMAGILGKGGNLSQASEALLAIASSGELTGNTFDSVARAATELSVATGRSSGDIAKQLISNKGDVAALAAEYNKQYHFMSAETYSHIQVLQTQGDEMVALELLTNQLADSMAMRNKDIENSARGIVGAWRDAKKAFSDYWSEFTSRAGADQDTFTLQVKQGQLDDVRARPESSLRTKAIKNLEKEIALIEQRQGVKQQEVEIDAKKDEVTQKGIEAERTLEGIRKASYTNKQKRDKEEEKYLRNVADLREANPNSPLLDQKLIDRDLANIRDKYKDPKLAAGSVNLTGFNDSKNQLTAILAEYSNAQKELDAAQKAGLISQADYALKREALIGNERDEVTAGYEAEIAALETVKGKASTSAAQRIQLDQKIADARTAMVKAQKEADSQLEVLATNETGRLAKQERAITSYAQALSQQQKALELAGRRAVIGVGQGDRQNALSGELNSQQDRFAQQSLELESQRSDPSRNMSDEEFTRKSQALADANKAATDQIRQNYADVEAAQGDWTKGATSAWANYLDSAQNVAGQTKSLFGNAFSSMEDAVVNFAMTGKLSFADFTKSILADMARIATRQASSALLSGLVGAGVSYFSGSGTATSAGSTSAGYSDAALSGWSGVQQANGGAWSSGVQLFANGGAFTNSVVSKPTAFGISGGQTGVMGEAGPEAIMPLTRTAGGQLGVRALGGGAGDGTTQINVQVTVASDGSTSATSDAPGFQQFGKELGDFVEQKYRQLQRKDLGQGGSIYRAIKG